MAFPTTPILDNFNRTDEGPPPGTDWFDDLIDGYLGLVTLSNKLALPVADAGYNESFWNATIGPDLEFYITLDSASVNCSFQIHARLNITNPFTRTGYYLHIIPGGSGGWLLYRRDTGFSDVLLTSGTEKFFAGDKAGFSIVGSDFTVYQYTSGAWNQIGTASDGTYSGSGYVAVGISDLIASGTALDDFGGGTLGGGGGPNPPVADFSGTPTSGVASLSVDFSDLSTNTPTSWAWDFGDGGTSTNKNPSYVYVIPGTYTVALTATNADGSDTETKTDYITVTSPSAPVADFNGVPVTGGAPLAVYFTDLSTNTPASWAWDFGDSGTSTDQNPIHTYTTPGVYTVALTVTNAAGSDTETKTDYITVLGAPVADFSGTPTSGTVSLSVDFTDLSTNSPTAWFWFFGDGFTDTTQNPTHVYTVVGVYTVALTASNLYGDDSETKFAYITVTDVAEVGPAEVENCDIDTGGLAVGLRVADVAIARDNNLGSLVIDASAELRAKDNAYGTLTNNGTLTSLAGDRSAWDTTAFPARHARDIDEATGLYHLVNAATQTYTVSNPSTDRAYDVTALTLNELAAVVGTLIADLIAKGLLS